MTHEWTSWCQWNYVKYREGRYDFFSWPMFITYAKTITEADAQFKQLLGVPPSKLAHIGVRWDEVTHVGMPADSPATAISEPKAPGQDEQQMSDRKGY